jgi:hypothetical protein
LVVKHAVSAPEFMGVVYHPTALDDCYIRFMGEAV